MNKVNISNWKDEIIKNTCELIQIPSVYEESTDTEMPFGKGPAQALEYMLELGKKLGFRTKNIDGYCGYIEFGEGTEMLGIIGHLDVVPPGDGWKHNQWGGIIEDGKIYGRGAIDDKEPVIASLYAMKAVKEQVKVNKRVRLILGLNEERSWKCIKHYKEKEELPTVSFSPDADFPCIYAEKGVLTAYVKQQYKNSNLIEITKIDCNNNAINVVPKYCKIGLKINSNEINLKELIAYAEKQIEENKFKIEITKTTEGIELISQGISSHAAHPDLGQNAISSALIILNEICNKYNNSIEIIDKFSKLIGMQYNGKNLGIDYKDESGELTLNVGNCKLTENEIQIGMNLRIPITIKIEKIQNILLQKFRNQQIDFPGMKQPLHIDKNNKLVQILCDTFNEVTGKQEEPIAIGGVTYARAFDNCVSFGANMPGEKDMCHQVDEFIKIDNLLMATQIYAEAIYKLVSK